MTGIADLSRALAESGCDPAGYRVLEPPGEATWCIRRQGRTWLVFYFERGTRYELQRFTSESHVCEYFLSRVTSG